MDSPAIPTHNPQAKQQLPTTKQCHNSAFRLAAAGKHPSSPPGRRRRHHHQVPSSIFSSSSSSSSSLSSSSIINPPLHHHNHHDDSLLIGPATPLRLISRVPFSWEHFPGIPKNSCNQNYCKNPSLKLLPLPPPTTNNHSSKSTQLHHLDHQTRIPKKNYSSNRCDGGNFQRDPFIAALVECSKSKDDHDNNNNNVAKISRSSSIPSDRFGFISLYASCKRTCAVSESLVHLPTSSRRS